MKRTLCLGFSALVLVAGFTASATAQSNVAIVDVGEIFKAHPAFSQELERLKTEAEQFQAAAMQLREEVMAKSEQLKIYTPGSDEFKQAETSLAEEVARLEVEQRDKMRKLMQREAQLHFQTYEQVKQLINQYCEAGGIRLVLRHSEIELDIDNPNSVMQQVNSQVVFYRPAANITDAIIRQMNGTASANSNINR